MEEHKDFMVEWRRLGDIADIGTGSNNREDACENGLFPFFVRSQEVLRINTYLYDEEAILIPGEGGIGDIFHYINGKYGLHQRTYRVHPATKTVLGKYIYYYLFENFKSYINQKSFKSTAASIRKPMLLDFQIAVPPFSEQTRIVGILDTFTSAVENLKQQIAQRRKQYEHYRDKLLDLEGKEGVEMKMIGDVASFGKGRIGASFLSPHNYVSVENLVKDKGGRVDTETVPIDGKWSCYHENDILIGNIRPYLRKIWLSDREGGTNGDVIVIRPNEEVIPHYLYYILSSEKFFVYYNQTAKGGKMPRGEKARVLSFPVPLFSRVKQQRIVSILDTFEASIANLEQQLAQRERQYEYYRNKLLTFE